MGGRIWVDNAPSEGATFSFTVRAPAAPLQHWISPLQKIPALRGLRVLIVDDTEVNRRILLHYLSSWGMVSQATASPHEALDWIRRGDPYDVALLDFHMPDMDGIELARGIRELRSRAQLPLVMLGSSATEAIDKVFSAAAVKPLKPARLRDLLQELFLAGRPTSADAPELPAGLAAEHPLRILVAEDNAVNREVTRLLFHTLGYLPDFAADGLEAVAALDRQAYDLVLMDIQMPNMDGLSATREICRRWPPAICPTIIGLSANASVKDRREALQAGMRNYLTKPVMASDLVRTLRNCPRSSRLDAIAAVVDTAVLSTITRGEPELIRHIIATFIADTDVLVRRLEQAVTSENFTEVAASAHELAGASAVVGAITVADKARLVEHQALSDTQDTLLTLVGDLRGALKATTPVLGRQSRSQREGSPATHYATSEVPTGKWTSN
jgi:CheY-like chemotaxis protein